MKTLKASSQRGSRFVFSYFNSNKFSLSDCYTNCSTAKTRAQYFCREQMYKESGKGFKILGFNSSFFSCGWLTVAGLRVETVGGSYLVTF